VLAHVREFARAAKEGCDVSDVVPNALNKMLHERVGAAGLSTVTRHRVSPNKHPRAYAYEVLDRVKAVLADDALHTLIAPVVERVDTEILRVDTCPEECESGWRTCVKVNAVLRDPQATTIPLYIYADKQAEHTHREDSEY
jgi:hypothetical protein